MIVKTAPAFFALVAGMGAVHLAVGLTIAVPEKVHLGLAWGIGLVAFYLMGLHAYYLAPGMQAAVCYLLPVALCAALDLTQRKPGDWAQAQLAVMQFWATLLANTPPAAYVAVALYVVTRPQAAPPKGPIPPPPA